MKYTKIRLAAVNTVDLPIAGYVGTEPFILKSVDGLGPPEVDVFISNTNAQGVGFYQGRRPQDRQIVIYVGLNPDYSTGQNASDLREVLYGLLSRDISIYDFDTNTIDNPFGQPFVDILIMNGDTVLMQTKGYVTKVEVNPFTKDPEAQITLNSPNAYFESTDVDVTTFPFDKVGSASTGFYADFVFTEDTDSWTLGSGGTDAHAGMTFGYSFHTGDHIIVDTRAGQRSALLHIGGDTFNTVNMLGHAGTLFQWLQLDGKAINYITVPEHGNFVDFHYTPRYWGV